MPDLCPSCGLSYKDMLEHIRKKHPFDAYSDLQLQPFGLVSCPTCRTACRGAHGIKTHSAKVHGLAGASAISTLPRAASATTSTANSGSIAPHTPRPSQQPRPPDPRINRGQKRPAATPSPPTQRPRARPRTLGPARTLHRPRDPFRVNLGSYMQ